MSIATLIALLPVLGVVAGLARIKYPRAPYLAAAIVFAVYVLYVGSMAIWAGLCWDCESGAGDTRGDFLYVSAIFFGLIAGTALLGIWLGARMITMLGRLRHTWDELRGAPTREDGDAR